VCVRDGMPPLGEDATGSLIDPSWPLYVDAVVDGSSSAEEVSGAVSRVLRIGAACAALAPARPLGARETRLLVVLRSVVTRGLSTIEARRDPRARLGFSWPPFDLLAGGDPTDELNALSCAGLLRRRFHDRIHLCPGCGSAHLAFREVCRACESADARRSEVLHHYRCGHVATEERFRRGGELVCPGCDAALRHIGIDYERPTALLLCNACGAADGEGVTRARCLACGAIHTPEAVDARTVWTYHLTPRGESAARTGELEVAEE
jgi:hypothetical protein